MNKTSTYSFDLYSFQDYQIVLSISQALQLRKKSPSKIDDMRNEGIENLGETEYGSPTRLSNSLAVSASWLP